MDRRDNKGRILRTGESQRPNGRYRYTWRQSGKQRETGARTLRELRLKEANIKMDCYDGIASGHETVNDIYDRYMQSNPTWRNTTRSNYKYMYGKYVYGEIGVMQVRNVKYSDIKMFYNRLIEKDKLSIGSVGVIHTILHPVFDMAVRDNYIRLNPADGVMKEIKRSHNWSRPHRRALTVTEQINFMSYVRKSRVYGHWAPIFITLLGTGCRIGELLGLTRADCDFENNTISINHNLVYKSLDGKCEMHINDTKTDAGIRYVPMVKAVRNALLEQWKISVKRQDCNYEIDGYSKFIFVNREGHVHNPMAVNRAIKRILQSYNNEFELKPIMMFSVHNLRHTFCARLCENECNIKVIQELMGHSDISITMNIYAEITQEKKQDVLGRLEEKILPEEM